MGKELGVRAIVHRVTHFSDHVAINIFSQLKDYCAICLNCLRYEFRCNSKSFRRMQRETGCLQSMSRRGDCYANAHAESLRSTIKTEGFTQMPYTHQLDKLVPFDYVETFYNSRRHHSSLGWVNAIDLEFTSFNHQ